MFKLKSVTDATELLMSIEFKALVRCTDEAKAAVDYYRDKHAGTDKYSSVRDGYLTTKVDILKTLVALHETLSTALTRLPTITYEDLDVVELDKLRLAFMAINRDELKTAFEDAKKCDPPVNAERLGYWYIYTRLQPLYVQKFKYSELSGETGKSPYATFLVPSKPQTK